MKDHSPDPITQKLIGAEGTAAVSSGVSSRPRNSTPFKARPKKEVPAAQRIYMPNNFSPSPHEVIIGRGRLVVNHPANKLVRKLVLQELDAYTQAVKKAEKSEVLTGILDAIRAHTQVGFGFVKFETATKRWFAVEEIVARSTIAQTFRDTLSGQYRSSRQFKNQIRRQRQEQSSSSSSSVSSSLAPIVSDDGDDGDESRCSGSSSSVFFSRANSKNNRRMTTASTELFLDCHSLSQRSAASGYQNKDWWQQGSQVISNLPSKVLSFAQTEVQYRLPQEDSEVFETLYEAFANAKSFSVDSLEPTPIWD